MDHYLIYKNQIKRIISEYEKYGKIIIAYDFDDTIYDMHGDKSEYKDVINILKKLEDHAYFICFTCRTFECHDLINKYIKEKELPLHTINQNIRKLDYTMSKKPFYNILIDDRSGIINSYILLLDFYNYIEVKNEKRKLHKIFKKCGNACKRWKLLTKKFWVYYS